MALPPLTSGSYPTHSGKHMLAVRLTRFDPYRTLVGKGRTGLEVRWLDRAIDDERSSNQDFGGRRSVKSICQGAAKVTAKSRGGIDRQTYREFVRNQVQDGEV
jgi:hypothetical protein